MHIKLEFPFPSVLPNATTSVHTNDDSRIITDGQQHNPWSDDLRDGIEGRARAFVR